MIEPRGGIHIVIDGDSSGFGGFDGFGFFSSAGKLTKRVYTKGRICNKSGRHGQEEKEVLEVHSAM
jgi:hypothetical protein